MRVKQNKRKKKVNLLSGCPLVVDVPLPSPTMSANNWSNISKISTASYKAKHHEPISRIVAFAFANEFGYCSKFCYQLHLSWL